MTQDNAKLHIFVYTVQSRVCIAHRTMVLAGKNLYEIYNLLRLSVIINNQHQF